MGGGSRLRGKQIETTGIVLGSPCIVRLAGMREVEQIYRGYRKGTLPARLMPQRGPDHR